MVGRVMGTAWRIFWRVGIFLAILLLFGVNVPIGFGTLNKFFNLFVISIIVGGVLQLNGITLAERPFSNLLHFKKPFVRVGTTNTASTNGRKGAISYVSKASNLGFTSGFEPHFLKNVRIPSSPRIHGSPGIGLNSAHNVMSSSRIQAGQKGEENLAKILSMANGEQVFPSGTGGIIYFVDSFWSVAMPSRNNPRVKDDFLDTDIDCIITGGNKILLIDAKLYKGGAATYYNDGQTLYCRDDATNDQVGEPKHMSNNMKMALERFSSHYPAFDVQAYVVLVPTDSGTARIDNVRWPGGIPLIHPADLVRIVSPLSGYNTDARVLGNISSLLKH